MKYKISITFNHNNFFMHKKWLTNLRFQKCLNNALTSLGTSNKVLTLDELFECKESFKHFSSKYNGHIFIVKLLDENNGWITNYYFRNGYEIFVGNTETSYEIPEKVFVIASAIRSNKDVSQVDTATFYSYKSQYVINGIYVQQWQFAEIEELCKGIFHQAAYHSHSVNILLNEV